MSNSTQNDWEGKERLIKKIEDDILMDFIEDEHGQFQYKGKYYSPKFGCDMLIWIVDGVYGLLADARREVYEKGYQDGFDRKPRQISDSAHEYQKKLATLKKEGGK